MNALLRDLAKAIERHEGHYPPGTPGFPEGSISYRHRLDMLPSIFSKNSTYCRSTNSKLLSYFPMRDKIYFSNFAYLFFCNFCCSCSFPYWRIPSSFFPHISAIFNACSCKQMIRIKTRGIVAFMAHKKRRINIKSSKDTETNPRNLSCFSINEHRSVPFPSAIPLPTCRSFPYPTAILIYLSKIKKMFFDFFWSRERKEKLWSFANHRVAVDSFSAVVLSAKRFCNHSLMAPFDNTLPIIYNFIVSHTETAYTLRKKTQGFRLFHNTYAF